MVESDRLMTVKEVASLLNVAEVTVRRMTGRGDLVCYRVGDRNERRFRMSDIEVYLAKRRETSLSNKPRAKRSRRQK